MNNTTICLEEIIKQYNKKYYGEISNNHDKGTDCFGLQYLHSSFYFNKAYSLIFDGYEYLGFINNIVEAMGDVGRWNYEGGGPCSDNPGPPEYYSDFNVVLTCDDSYKNPSHWLEIYLKDTLLTPILLGDEFSFTIHASESDDCNFSAGLDISVKAGESVTVCVDEGNYKEDWKLFKKINVEKLVDKTLDEYVEV